MWNLLQGTTPFQAIQPDGVSFSDEQHLANVIALLGPPPRDLIERGRESLRYFDDHGELRIVCVGHIANGLSGPGKFKYPDLVPKDARLEQLLDRIEGDERSAFLGFMSKTLQWLPEDRMTAAELLSHPWVHIGI